MTVGTGGGSMTNRFLGRLGGSDPEEGVLYVSVSTKRSDGVRGSVEVCVHDGVQGFPILESKRYFDLYRVQYHLLKGLGGRKVVCLIELPSGDGSD